MAGRHADFVHTCKFCQEDFRGNGGYASHMRKEYFLRMPDMKNVKWVVEIELSDQEYEGYWQTRGWSDTAEVQTLSRIDTQEATKLEDGSAAIGGIAFAGIRGISKVEVSIDDGLTWNETELKPALNELTWNLWTYQWQADPGNYDVLVRATDGAGQLQDPEVRRPLPDGATGYHKVNVKVS